MYRSKIKFSGIFTALFFCLVFLFSPARAQPELAKLFSDNAVLQREKPIPVWGWAKPFEDVKVSLADQNRTTKANEKGKWIVTFSAMKAGGHYSLKASANSGNAKAENILIGDVWLCSGQSNMEWPVSRSDNFDKEKRDANYPQIRHFYVDHKVDIVPQEKLDSGEWKISSPETFGDFTAVGFLFAREIHKEIGVPIGLLHSSWGGSQIESWISKEGMLGSDVLKDYAKKFPKNWQEADALLERNIKRQLFGDENKNPTLADEKKYTRKGYDFSGWHRSSAIGQWDWKGIWAWRGNGFMAKKVEIPETLAAQDTILSLADGYGYMEVFINGKEIFRGTLKDKRVIDVPKNTWRGGKNDLVLKINKLIEPEWFGTGLMGSPDDLFTEAKGKKILLGNSGWYLMPSFAEPHTFAHSSNNVGTVIFNAMIAPLLPFGLRGFLWYQGETNAGRAFEYRKTFPLLIKDWRKKWNEELPFYFVQLSSFGANQSSDVGSGWAELREAQTMALSLPNTGMAVTIDIGNPFDIHPTNKQDVGKRLAANALKFTYGKDVLHSGPMFDSVRFENSKAIISFKFIGEGLRVKDKYGYLRGFEIAGADRKFYYAQAGIEGDKVVVHSKKVAEPVAVRYAWADAPIDANLFNSASLPAAPFRTDDWDGVTVNAKFH